MPGNPQPTNHQAAAPTIPAPLPAVAVMNVAALLRAPAQQHQHQPLPLTAMGGWARAATAGLTPPYPGQLRIDGEGRAGAISFVSAFDHVAGASFNILVKSREPLHINLADFGVAKAGYLETHCGTLTYSPPEFQSDSRSHRHTVAPTVVRVNTLLSVAALVRLLRVENYLLLLLDDVFEVLDTGDGKIAYKPTARYVNAAHLGKLYNSELPDYVLE
ncbi:hypothetical protein C8A05DRAFT_39690 [Staphylotrichum tortipilum]|uniref:Uncharacterized protein n=1 Tax=Staphylotrichum tortipilum TaxID=2831512 RepID=A0AAN6M9I6_9PEZI|nr:hypothetical protein C8A05DRAFT_39690 [Staphylotrichum longicolle]